MQERFIDTILDTDGPVSTLIVSIGQPRKHQADRILRARNDPGARRIVIAEEDLASFSQLPGGIFGPHNSNARRRVLEAMPLRSLNSSVGSSEIVTTGPG